jgi:divalent metal cation (Fe/Co/Zn/Cd) transporter
LDAFLGFLGFFAFLAVIQAVINVVQPEPKVWPALLALVLVLATVSMWRIRRK